MKRRILLVDDEVAVLLTLKTVLEISGFEVDTAASAREGKHKLRTQEFHMVISDMRMESDASGAEVVAAARTAPYHPAVALLTAFPIADEDWQSLGADKMLVKPMQVQELLEQIENLLARHEAKLKLWTALPPRTAASAKKPAKKTLAAKPAASKPIAKKPVAKKPVAKKPVAKKLVAKKAVHAATKRVVKKAAKKTAERPAKR